ncbi:MAG: glycosyltransferase family 9 protein [Candidatus Cloacimonadaceae bacterium]|nr:glycosyltransferase family 9 protein [Candidatus Cloacimonadaceae bacterium]
MKADKIILIQLSAIGDTLMCEPALSAIRKAHPLAEITFLTSSAASPILDNHPDINRLIVWKKKTPFLKHLRFLLSLRKRKYDILVDFQKNPRTYLMSFVTRAKNKISFRGKRRNSAYTELVKEVDVANYAAYEKFRFVQRLLPPNMSPTEPRVFISPDERARARAIYESLGYRKSDLVIALSPVSKASYRAWKAENYALLCDHLYHKYNCKFIFTWGPGERHMVDEILSMMKSPKPNTDYRIDSLQVLYGLFELSDMYLGNDNGPRHLAIAAGLPTMCIFSHFYHSHWTPPNDGKHGYVEPKLRDANGVFRRIDSVDYPSAQKECERIVELVLRQKTKNDVCIN